MKNKKRKLKIAQIAPIWYDLPPEKYAGIERIAYYLTEGLVRRGHQVTLFATGNSKTSARLVSLRKRSLSEDNIPWSDTFWELEQLSFAFRHWQEFDIIHSHIGLRALFFQDFVKRPVLHTFHNPIYSKRRVLPPSIQILNLHRKTTNACFISKSEKKLSPVNLRADWVVYNGIDANLFKFNQKPKDYLLWVGRVCDYKGIENAIDAAEKLNAKLLLAGKIDAEKKEYFEEKIRPRLSKKIRYLGEVGEKELVSLYQGARAFLYPIEWEEPFGLTMVEAQACGTPVVAFKRGSVPEVVRDGKTGFVVPFLDKSGKKNIKGIIEAVKKTENIKRIDCRRWVEENFTIEKMVENYEKIYYQMAKKG